MKPTQCRVFIWAAHVFGLTLDLKNKSGDVVGGGQQQVRFAALKMDDLRTDFGLVLIS